ncbi:MAG: prepilin-type N-terminal cleavage/methylation domain-containing protein [Patescibacteria group bacterium]|nr:prepilin-type N-terminal cleavage/methylation domain-containing protein [Patescibacteria group bacterium]MDE2588237.1 prepilin-type N-terminal cleavage/methylation domain-containing protein [Patescibacteria group bacterium]
MKRLFVQNILKNQKGITLVELLLYMGIFSTLLMVLVQLFGSIVSVNLESEANSSVSQDGRYILNRLSYDIRQAVASSITAPAGLGTANAGSTLSFNSSGGQAYTYFLSSDVDHPGLKDIDVTTGGNTDRLNSIGTTISNLQFILMKSTATTTPKYIVTVSFTLTSTTREQKGYQTKNFQTTVGTRQ